MADTSLDAVRKSAAREVAVLRERLTDAIDDVLDDRDDELADRLVEAALGVFDEAAIERMAQHYVDDTHIRSMEFRNGAEMELVPAQDMVAVWVATARTMLGDAPNYSETRVDLPAEKVEMELKLAGEVDRYVFTVQRAGKLTPHEARVRAEAERDEARAELKELTGSVRETEWGSGKDESYVKVCGAPNDAYDYARAYGERVFTRKLYAGPWVPDDEDGDD